MRPYLIVPRLIEQPTWGGTYITEIKGWHEKPGFQSVRIGQSFELFGQSKLLTTITTTSDPRFLPETGTSDGGEKSCLYKQTEYITIADLVNKQPEATIGPDLAQKSPHMPLLIKLNQAAGNSFQLHVKPGTQHPRWKPKPESWYFLEPGYISCGISMTSGINEYKHVCQEIDEKMKSLSHEVINKSKTVDTARNEAQLFIAQKNPWQYVNRFEMQKYDLVDLSEGGVHHSWEENKETYPLGNIVYEVQLDVMDPDCTIRSFDQGKIKEDGSIREIHIDDYFQFLDTDPKKNDIHALRRTRKDNTLLQTPYYSMDILEITGATSQQVDRSFHHLYVRDGDISVHNTEGEVRLTRGHSCFVPYAARAYAIKSHTSESVVLKTYL